MNSPTCLRYALSGERHLSHSLLSRLRLFGVEQSYLHLSPMMHFEGEECIIGDQDPNEIVKLQAQGLVITPTKKVVTICPDRFSAFVAQMPNKQLAIFGMAEYPETIQDSSGTCFVTNFGDRACWFGTIPMPRSTREKMSEADRESHRLVVDTLNYAEHMGILRILEDPFSRFKPSGNHNSAPDHSPIFD